MIRARGRGVLSGMEGGAQDRSLRRDGITKRREGPQDYSGGHGGGARRTCSIFYATSRCEHPAHDSDVHALLVVILESGCAAIPGRALARILFIERREHYGTTLRPLVRRRIIQRAIGGLA